MFTQGELRNRIVAKDATGIPGKFIFWQDATGDLTFQVYNSLATWCLASIPISPDGSWMHVVGVFDTTDQRVRLYKDGIEVDSAICPGFLKSNTEAAELVKNGGKDKIHKQAQVYLEENRPEDAWKLLLAK